MHIGLLLFPRLTQLDLTGPFEVFANTPGATVHLLWKTKDPIQAITGMRIVPDTTLALMSMAVDVARWYDPEIKRTPEAIGAAYADLGIRLVTAH